MVWHVAGFDWDDGNRAKCRKHGVSVAEIEELFQSEVHVAPDFKHSELEDRRIAVGGTSAGRHVFVAFTLRTRAGKKLIRPVTARYMHAREIVAYEKEIAKTKER